MKFTTLFVLTLGATLTGVLAAPILNGGNMAIANMEKREAIAEPVAIAKPDIVHDELTELALAAAGDPFWCGAPFCGKEKRDAVAESAPVEVEARSANPVPIISDKREAIPSPLSKDPSETKLVKRPMGPPPGFPHPKCGENLCQPYGRPPMSKREAEVEHVAEVKLAKKGPPPGFPHPKCGENLCQPYGRPPIKRVPTIMTRATTALKEFVKRQYDCGAPFCFGESGKKA